MLGGISKESLTLQKSLSIFMAMFGLRFVRVRVRGKPPINYTVCRCLGYVKKVEARLIKATDY